MPIATIIAWPVNTLPDASNGTWLECNGQSTSGYPKLAAIIGATTPDFRNKFLEGSTFPGQIIEAGLPNITGYFGEGNSKFVAGGAMYATGWNHALWGSGGDWDAYMQVGFDASRSNAIYGKSNTVQPPAITVKYLIKAQ